MKYKGIIFDLDGTLINSLDDIADSTNRTLIAQGFSPHPTEAYRHFIGDGLRNLILRTVPPARRGDEATIARCMAAFSADYGVNWSVKTRLYPGIAEALNQLAAMGMKLAVLSNKPDEFTQACAARFLAKWRFDIVMGASTRFAHKPDPAAALAIAAQLQLAPADMLYLGDMPVDMQTARNADIFAIGAAWGFRTRQELTHAGAQRVIDTPLELPAIARS